MGTSHPTPRGQTLRCLGLMESPGIERTRGSAALREQLCEATSSASLSLNFLSQRAQFVREISFATSSFSSFSNFGSSSSQCLAMWPRRTALRSSSPTAKKRRTCLINFCLYIPRLCGASVAVDAIWITQIRLAVLGFLQLVCDPALSTRTLTATEVLSHACRTLGDACTPGHK